MFPAFSLAQRLIVVALLALAPPVFAEDQEFRLERPDAQSVGLAGEFNDWKSQPMAKGNNGIWTGGSASTRQIWLQVSPQRRRVGLRSAESAAQTSQWDRELRDRGEGR